MYNEFSSDEQLHDLNIFIARLLFCFFAEDSGIFEPSLFTNSIIRYTKEDGSDLTDYLDSAFNVMNVRERNDDTLKIISQFPYVNGGLFAKQIRIPKMGRRARKLLIECGELDWQDINPDIFGSMIQAVVNPETRATEGMHYTSVPNIMKVINPLFLDELREEYNKIKEDFDRISRLHDVDMYSSKAYYDECKPIYKRCKKLLARMSKMKFFDPACGSGNFLVITYKMLRLLEMDIIMIMRGCQQSQQIEFIDNSCIRLNQFYGIELLDFPHEVAMLSLWLAEHQMNKKFYDNFGVNTAALPLKTITNIKCGNACRMDWNKVCPHEKDEEVFVFGNPPYQGARLQNKEQKDDMKLAVKDEIEYNNLDYIAAWFYKGAGYIKNSQAKFAFVSTNSICQGEQVALLWPKILEKNVEIYYAYESFKWKNNAKNNAGVTCVIIGLRNESKAKKYIYNDTALRVVKNISPYLVEASNTIVTICNTAIANIPGILFGSMANDGSNLLLTAFERDELLKTSPEAAHFIHPILGSLEFIRGQLRYCLWIKDNEVQNAMNIPDVRKRIEACEKTRAESTRANTRQLAQKPYAFGEIRYKESPCIIVPAVSSEKREYIPMGFLPAGTVVSNSAFAVYNASMWLFGILTSRMHMAWVRTVGGRLKTDYRYSAGLCYNTFPFPKLSTTKREAIEKAAEDVLIARAYHPGNTLAQLYNPDTMPDNLKKAHERLDDIIDSCYAGYPFASDEQRLECLFRMYEKMTEGEK